MKKNKIGLSPHTLNLFIECPRCFYLEVNYKIKRPRGPMASIATGLDSIIKKYFDYYRDNQILPPFLEGKIEGKLIEEKIKKTLYYDINKDFVLFGRLDECIHLNDGTYVPLDHKTRSSPPDKVHPAYQFQMEVYSLLLKGNNYPISNFAYLVYYYPEESKIHNGISFGFDVKKIETDINHAIEIIKNAVETLKEEKIPSNSLECEYCKWFENIKEYSLSDKNGEISVDEVKEEKDTLF